MFWSNRFTGGGPSGCRHAGVVGYGRLVFILLRILRTYQRRRWHPSAQTRAMRSRSSCPSTTKRNTSRPRSTRSWRLSSRPALSQSWSSWTTARPTEEPTRRAVRSKTGSATIVSQPNRGRFEARRAGLEAATGDWVLLLDSTRHARPGAWRSSPSALDAGERGLERARPLDDGGTRWRPSGVCSASSPGLDYFDAPAHDELRCRGLRPLPEGDDVLPRSSGAAPRRQSTAFRSRYADPRHRERRHAADPLDRGAEPDPHLAVVSPATTSRARRSSRSSRHSVHRGIVFLDGHGRPESRFFPR